MALTVLVTGLLEHDSGKTWLGRGLVRLAKERGLRVAAYKPVGGFNIWHSYWAFRESVSKGTLAGGDALGYHSDTGLALELVNPVALALGFPDPLAVPGPAYYTAAASSTESSLVMARVTGCDGSRIVLAFHDNIDRLPATLRREVEEAASRLGAEAGDPRVFSEWLSGGEASALLEECRRRLSGADVLVIESFNDAVLPYEALGLEDLDFLVVVAPGKALLYTGGRLRLALETVGRQHRIGRVLSLLGKPLHAEDLPPARSLDEYTKALGSTRLASMLLA